MASPEQNKERDAITGVETTGHEWDGLKELNNPAPRWWLWVFFATVVWSVGYWVVYPTWPTLSGHTQGKLGWTQYKRLKETQAEIVARKTEHLEKLAGKSLEEIKNAPDMYAFAVAGGNAAFKDNCATCHGSGGAGGNGYPNLNDDDWIWGGSLEEIYNTIKVGVRSGHPDMRDATMPAFGRDGIIEPNQIEHIANHVLSLSKDSTEDADGKTLFEQNCASCHGMDGKGNREMGAPNLADAIWLYGSDMNAVVRQISNPRMGVMPAWESRLSDDTIKQLAIYVHALGGGEHAKSGAAPSATEPPAASAAE